jgi:hypothetical protein
VAFYPLKPYQWIEEEVNWRWRSNELRNGVVVEVGSSDEDGSFTQFKQRITKGKPEVKGFDRKLTVQYKTRSGDQMKFTFNGERMLNGKSVRLTDYRFFNGPFLQGDRRSGVIKMTYKDKVRALDFNTVSIKE